MAQRHDQWAHTHVVGNDRAAAAPYVPDARKLLGMVTADAAHNGLQTHQMTRRYEDGAVIVAEIRGGIPRMTIVPPPAPMPPPSPDPLDDFVVWARTPTLPAGIDATHPQQILKHLASQRAWRTYTFNAEVSGGRSDGTYAGVFPAGLKYAGNIDFRTKDDARISWYGPTNRYWFERYRLAKSQYGRYVFGLGQILLDVDDYCEQSDVDFPARLVMGAALVGNKLTVMQAKIDDWPSPQTVPTPGPLGTTVIHEGPLPPGPVQLQLLRYTVTPDRNIIPGSHVELWAGTYAGCYSPWVFAPDGMALETFAMPAQITATSHLDAPRNPSINVRTYDVPSASSAHYTLTIAGDDTVTLATTPISIALDDAAGGEAVVAADYDADGNRLELVFGYTPVLARQYPNDWPIFELDWADYYYRIGDFRLPLSTVGPDGFLTDLVSVVVLDIRTRSAALKRMTQTLTAEFKYLVARHLDVYHRGARYASAAPGDYLRSAPGSNLWMVWHSHAVEGGLGAVSPWYFIAGAALAGDTVNPDGSSNAERWAFYDGPGADCFFHNSFLELFGLVITYDRNDGSVVGGVAMHSSAVAPSNFNNAHYDQAGNFRYAALCAGDTAVLYSGPLAYTGPDNTSPLLVGTYATDGVLQALTGVAGDDAVFHPIWLLGKPPLIP